MASKRSGRIELREVGDITIATFTDERILEDVQIANIRTNLENLVDELSRRKVVLNFRNVEYFSSAALKHLISLNKKLLGNGGKRLVLSNVCADVYEVFEITRLHKFFSMQKSEEAAVASL